MSNINIYLNNQQLIDLGTKLNCKYDELPKVIKSSLIEETNSKWYRNWFKDEKVEIVEIDKESIIDEYLRNNEYGVVMQRRSDIMSKPVFTLASEDPEYQK